MTWLGLRKYITSISNWFHLHSFRVNYLWFIWKTENKLLLRVSEGNYCFDESKYQTISVIRTYLNYLHTFWKFMMKWLTNSYKIYSRCRYISQFFYLTILYIKRRDLLTISWSVPPWPLPLSLTLHFYLTQPVKPLQCV